MNSILSDLYHDELIGTMAYDSFRGGFILGARLVMEVVSGNE